MTTRRWIAGLAALGLAAGALAAPKDFEGTLTMKMEHGGQANQMTYAIKGKMLRVDMPAGGPHGGAAMIMNTATETMLMLMPEQRMYMEMRMPRPPANAKAKADVKVVKTGKTETILGYVCEQWTITGAQGVSDAWVAKGLGTFRGLGGPMAGGPRPAWEGELVRDGAFPFRVVTHDAAGAETGRMTVTAIDRKALADSLFKAPEGWQKMDMPAGHPGMGGGPGMGGHPDK